MASKLERFTEISKHKREKPLTGHDETRRQYQERADADKSHKTLRPGHEIITETDNYSGPIVRQACSCGWRGPWFRKGFEDFS